MLNYLHQLFYTFKNKLRREKRKKNSQIIPKQKNNFLDYKGDKIFDPIIFTPNFINDKLRCPYTIKKLPKYLILNKMNLM